MTDVEGPSIGTTASASWRDVHARLAARDSGALDADELERLAEAAFWLGRPRDEIAAWQRAYVAHRRASNTVRATKAAWWLFHIHFDLDEIAAAGGWLNRAHRHVIDAPGSVERGYVAIADATMALYHGRTDDALVHARHATATGHEHGDAELMTLGLAHEGRARVARGDVAEGMVLLDEAMVAATGDEFGPFVTGWVYCMLLYTCQVLGDVRRAGEWTDSAVRWSQERGLDSWYPGLCRLHRCEVAALRGEWSTAEDDALLAAAELTGFGDYLIADAQYLAGEIRRRRGDYPGAEEAFRLAHEFGREPQPGLALLRLARGEVEAAVRALRLALAREHDQPMPRARLLAAHVQVQLRAGDVEAAGRSADELTELARHTGVPLLDALAAGSKGAVLLAENAAEDALPVLRNACAVYRRLSCPYELAQTRILLGIAARRAGDDDTARLEIEAARTIYQRLGARPDAEEAATLLAEGVAHPAGLTAREVEVLRLVAGGLSNRAVAGELVISEHTVARHLSNIFGKLGVNSRSAATAFAFEHGLA